ncbi:MAG: sulfatase [Planctomycetota bacterium]|nr:sulfatase [Planctomycetota bacterium]
MRSLALRQALPLAALLLGCAGCSDAQLPTDHQRLNVLLITVDTLRADHVGTYGYGRGTTPAIDALAERGVVFENALAPAPWTLPSVASIHTGLYPSAHGIQRIKDRLSDEATTLAEVLGAHDYRTVSIVSNSLVRPHFGFGQGFDAFDTSEAAGHDHVSTPGLTKLAKRRLARFAESDRPFFLSLLHFDPHYDWLDHGLGLATDAGSSLAGDESIERLRLMASAGELGPPEVAALRSRYDEEIRFTDDGIAELLAELERLGLADDTLVVLVADHGEEFLEHGWLGHTRYLYQGMVHVPLIVADPRHGDQHQRRVAPPVSTVSVMATVLELAGIDPAPYQLDAASLAGYVAQGASSYEPGPVFSEVDFVPTNPNNHAKVAHLEAVLEGHTKTVRSLIGNAHERYDLEADPGELVDLAKSPAGLAAARESGALLDAWREAREARALPRSQGQTTKAERERIEKLGYLDG